MEVKFETIKRISGLYHYVNSGILKKNNMNGFIKISRSNNIMTFSGIALDIEGTDNYVMDNILNNIKDAYYIRGKSNGKVLKLVTLSNKMKPLDYKLIRMGLNDYYGSCFEVNFKTNFEQIDKMILSYTSSMKDYSKVSIKDLDINTNKDHLYQSFGSSMYKLHKTRLPINVFINNLMKKEESYTLEEAFEKRSAEISKILFKEKNN